MARGFYRVWCKIKAALKLNELEFRPTPACIFAILQFEKRNSIEFAKSKNVHKINIFQYVIRIIKLLSTIIDSSKLTSEYFNFSLKMEYSKEPRSQKNRLVQKLSPR